MAAVVPSVVTLPPVAAAPSKEAVDDALADADFHIEYGLYDEAVALLKRAMAKDPTQAALLEKLAEVYATVRKPAEFEQVVAQLRGRLGEREGDRITELRRLLLLPRPLPKDYEDKTVLGAPQSPIAPSVELMPPSPGGSHKFDLSDFDSPPPPPRPRPSATVTRGEPEDVPPSPPPRPRPSAIITRGEPEDVLPSPSSAAPEPAALSADELANELATKLDLARAYSDMGDNDAARALIQEVVHGPSATLRREAEELLRRLGV
jgi:FimV-like protein